MTDSFLDFYYKGGIILLFFLQKEEVGNVFATHLGLLESLVMAETKRKMETYRREDRREVQLIRLPHNAFERIH